MDSEALGELDCSEKRPGLVRATLLVDLLWKGSRVSPIG